MIFDKKPAKLMFSGFKFLKKEAKKIFQLPASDS